MKKISVLVVAVVIYFTNYLALHSEERKLNFMNSTSVTLSFFYTGELLGELEPCGCGGEKLGGISLRGSWIKHLKNECENLYLIDGGFASFEKSRQSQIKFSYYHKMLRQLGYQYCFLQSKQKIPPAMDIKKSPTFIAVARKNILSFQMHSLTANGHTYKTLFLAIEGEKPTGAKIEALVKKCAPDVVFIMTRDVYNYTTLVSPGKYMVIVFPTDAQEPFSPINPRDDLLVISAGNRGRYAGLLQLTLHKKQLPTWKNKTLPLTAKYPQVLGVTTLLESYKRQVKKERLLERKIKQISPVGYVGSEICQICHEGEYEQWSTTAHAHAFKTLENENYHYDPECVGCHTVGYEYEEGFRTLEDSPHLLDVGCESCHGAGAEHVVIANDTYGKTKGKNGCIHCHTQDRSPHFKYEEYKEKIKHWQDGIK